MKKIMGGRGINRLERVISLLERHRKAIGTPSKDILALAVLGVESDRFLQELVALVPEKVPFMKRDHRTRKHHDSSSK